MTTAKREQIRISTPAKWTFVAAKDGATERIECGPGRDKVTADRKDRVSKSCEAIRRR